MSESEVKANAIKFEDDPAALAYQRPRGFWGRLARGAVMLPVRAAVYLVRSSAKTAEPGSPYPYPLVRTGQGDFTRDYHG